MSRDTENIKPSTYDLWNKGQGHCKKAKMFQAYKGQLKLAAYVNYGLLTVHSEYSVDLVNIKLC